MIDLGIFWNQSFWASQVEWVRSLRLREHPNLHNVEAVIIKIRFRCMLCYNDDEERSQ